MLINSNYSSFHNGKLTVIVNTVNYRLLNCRVHGGYIPTLRPYKCQVLNTTSTFRLENRRGNDFREA